MLGEILVGARMAWVLGLTWTLGSNESYKRKPFFEGFRKGFFIFNIIFYPHNCLDLDMKITTSQALGTAPYANFA